jgi:hypothetical protein
MHPGALDTSVLKVGAWAGLLMVLLRLGLAFCRDNRDYGRPFMWGYKECGWDSEWGYRIGAWHLKAKASVLKAWAVF